MHDDILCLILRMAQKQETKQNKHKTHQWATLVGERSNKAPCGNQGSPQPGSPRSREKKKPSERIKKRNKRKKHPTNQTKQKTDHANKPNQNCERGEPNQENGQRGGQTRTNTRARGEEGRRRPANKERADVREGSRGKREAKKAGACSFSGVLRRRPDGSVGVALVLWIRVISRVNAAGSSTSAFASANGLSRTMAMSISPPSFWIRAGRPACTSARIATALFSHRVRSHSSRAL